jgi:Flp pilus assembly protein TadD
MPLPLGSMIRFTAILGCTGVLAACADPVTGAKETPATVSKELVKSKDDSLLRVAEVARDNADYPSAIRLFKTLLQSGDTRAEVHIGLGDCLFLTGAYAEATTEYNAVDEHSPKIADAEVGLGRILLAQHKPAEANLEFDGALKRLPADVRALNGAGVSLDDLGRHQEAQIYYQRGLAVAPDDRTLRNNYGLSLALAGDYGRAVTVLRPLAEEPGATPRNRQNLALALALSGNRAEAERVARVDLDTASVNNNLRFYEALRATPAAPGAAPALAVTPALPPAAPPAPAVAQAAPAIIAPAPVPVAAAPVMAAPTVLTPAPEPPPVVVATAVTPPVTPVPLAAPPPPSGQTVGATALPPPAAVAPPVMAALAPASPRAGIRPAESKGSGQFAVQLAVYQKVSGIAAGWQKYKTGHADVVGALEPRVAMVDLGDGRGPLYRLKAGPFHSASDAEAACQRLKSEGSDCRVSDFDGAPAQEYWKEHQIE